MLLQWATNWEKQREQPEDNATHNKLLFNSAGWFVAILKSKNRRRLHKAWRIQKKLLVASPRSFSTFEFSSTKSLVPCQPPTLYLNTFSSETSWAPFSDGKITPRLRRKDSALVNIFVLFRIKQQLVKFLSEYYRKIFLRLSSHFKDLSVITPLY